MRKSLVRLISDFNIAPLSGFLNNDLVDSQFDIEVTPYSQIHQSLECLSDSWLDIVWTRPESVLLQFYRALQFEEVSHEDVLDEVDSFAEAIIRSSSGRHVFVAAWVLPNNTNCYGMLDWKSELGVSSLLARCNLRLAELVSQHSNIFLLPTERWFQGVSSPISDKMWYVAKVPYASDVFAAASKQIAHCIGALRGKSRRMIILDLDNTLWGGVVGENGWEGLRLGGHDHVGEAFVDFQRHLKALTNRGIQLAISSKNDVSVAMEAIDQHSGMILKRDDFAGWRINWDDKASNIASLLDELNLGVESAVFIDDNPAERSRVSQALPGMLVPDWPEDPSKYVAALSDLGCFESPAISKEDRGRKFMYVAERTRREVKSAVGSVDDWLTRLGTIVKVSGLNAGNLSRITQLFNKTNQLNLATRRLSESEIADWVLQENRKMMAISVSDQFGDMGLVGVVSVESSGKEGRLVDFILSCRVMGRKVEETLIHLAACELGKLNAETMEVSYVPTERNRPTLEVLEKANLFRTETYEFKVDVSKGFEKPSVVELEFAKDAV